MAQSHNDLSHQISTNITTELHNTIMDAIMAIGETNNNTADNTPPLQANAATKPDPSIDDLKQMIITLQSTVDNLSNPKVTQADINPKTGKQ